MNSRQMLSAGSCAGGQHQLAALNRLQESLQLHDWTKHAAQAHLDAHKGTAADCVALRNKMNTPGGAEGPQAEAYCINSLDIGTFTETVSLLLRGS